MTLGVGELEAIKSFPYNGTLLSDNLNFGYARGLSMPKVEFHVLVSRQHPLGEALLRGLNECLKGLRERGELQAPNKSYTN